MTPILDSLLPPTPAGDAPQDYRFHSTGIAPGCRLYSRRIHASVCIGTGSVIWWDAQLLEGVEIGEQCQIGAYAFLGARCKVGAHSQLHHCVALAAGTVIGAYCYIGCMLVTTDVKEVNLRDRTQEIHEPPVIEDDVVIGQHVTLNPGVVVHRGARVWSGAVVSRDVPAGWTVAGVPARRVHTARLPFEGAR